MPRKRKTILFHFRWEVRQEMQVVHTGVFEAIDFMAARAHVDKHFDAVAKKKKLPKMPMSTKTSPVSRWRPIRHEQTGRIYSWFADNRVHRISARIRRIADPAEVKAFIRRQLKRKNKKNIDTLYREVLGKFGRFSCDRMEFSDMLTALQNRHYIVKHVKTQSIEWIPPAQRPDAEPAAESNDGEGMDND